MAADYVPAALRPADTEPLAGLRHADVLALELGDESGSHLVDHIVERGTVGTIAGVPETHKTFLASAIAHGVARGDGEILGRRIVACGPVGYFWQDDSRQNMVERIQQLGAVRNDPTDLDLVWFLNTGLSLPRDIDRLRELVEQHSFVLAVLDSFYNVAPGVSLKDEDAAVIVAQLKRDVCDPTGCAVLIVDHAPWPTDQNRGQRRAYGSVLKGAAIRWGIYLDRDGSKLYVEARGNNIRGLKRTPAYFDADHLELRLVDVQAVDTEDLDGRVLDYVQQHSGASNKQVEDDVEGGRESIRKSLERLASHEHIASGPGRHPRGKYWYPANHAALNSPDSLLATLGDTSPAPSQGHESPDSLTPRRGGESPGDTMNGQHDERLAAAFHRGPE